MAGEKTWTFNHTVKVGRQNQQGEWGLVDAHPSVTVVAGPHCETVNFDPLTGDYTTADAALADALRKVLTIAEIGGRAGSSGKPQPVVTADP